MSNGEGSTSRSANTAGAGSARATGPRLAGLVSLVAALGCGTGLTPTRLATPMRGSGALLQTTVSEVHVSAELREQDFSDDSRVLVPLQLEPSAAGTLDLQAVRLRIGAEPAHAPIATGTGTAPRTLVDDEYAPVLPLLRGKRTSAWVAFGDFEPRSTREIPERVMLVMPDGSELVLSDPGRPPIWAGQPVKLSTGLGAWFQLSADESAFNYTFAASRWALGPLVLSYRTGVGIRAGGSRSPGESADVCCNFGFAADLAWPVVQLATLVLAPYAGMEAAVLTHDDDSIERRNWLGPALGVNLALGRLLPRHGPFPIHYPASVLGAYNLRLALVSWFGDGRSFPSFGVVGGVDLSYGH